MGLDRYGRNIERLDEGRYRLDRSLGSGGMADVWLAWDEQRKRQVAIKVIRPEVLEQKTLNRFMKEALQLAQWDHQHILHVYDSKLELLDAAYASVIPYIVMEYAESGDLKQRLRMGKPYPFENAIRLFAELCAAVQYAHERGIIHRDLKPGNILFRRLPDGSEQAVLSDFGLAVDMNASQMSLPYAGTPAYMAPEQREGDAEPASDIYALGVILYQLCTGWLPSQKNSRLPGELHQALPKALDKVILKALAKDPAKRYASVALFSQAVLKAVTPSKEPVPESQKEDTRNPALPAGEAMPAANATASRPPDTAKSPHSGVVATVTAAQKPASPPTSGPPDSSAAVNAVLPHGNNGANASPTIPVRQPIRRNWLLGTGLILLILLFIFGGIAYAASGIVSYFTGGKSAGLFSSSSTVTITPATKTLKNAYVITAIIGKPSASQRQVQARILSASPSQSQTAKATGVKQTPGTRATGTLTFYNGSTSPFTVAANTLFVTASGVQIVNDIAANIPATNPPNYGTATVPAHAVNVGTSGNIPALAINGTCCASGNFILVKNLSAFSGGQDPQNYTFLQQSDVDAVANPLEQRLMASAQANLKGQKQSGEQFVNTTNPITCNPTVTANPPVGSKATSATVTVQVTCSGEVYDQQGALAKAASLYKNDSTINPGAGFALAGSVSTSLTQASVVDNKGTILLQVTVEGTWVYQTAKLVAQEKSWARQIAGKSKQQAIAFLLGQPGVGIVSIQFSGNTLPTDPNQISFTIQNVPVSSSPTPG